MHEFFEVAPRGLDLRGREGLPWFCWKNARWSRGTVDARATCHCGTLAPSMIPTITSSSGSYSLKLHTGRLGPAPASAADEESVTCDMISDGARRSTGPALPEGTNEPASRERARHAGNVTRGCQRAGFLEVVDGRAQIE
jgi:hypothetical protein